ncbi:hypothetical protein BDQ12DRAFT_673545 [Crucibulum laeve]|uniref:Amidohydrolase-related domain-containing protein n=1 Tax=Crucibulum laeve TaxID=68775 RepID=A0A5C3MTQ4_9AGAR|nr:hypothetical protein BDQ12DRAFT_673545 [Crucibulum laeve]
MMEGSIPHRRNGHSFVHRPMCQFRLLSALGLFTFIVLNASQLHLSSYHYPLFSNKRAPVHAAAIISRCRQLSLETGPPSDFHTRSQSDRFVPGAKPVLVKNARIWTGGKNGTEILRGDILLDKGLIKSIGRLGIKQTETYGNRLVVVDAKGAWITPGIVDIHSHLAVGSSPELSGAIDDNSYNGIVQPWLRSLDGLNTHDDAYLLSVAGGVTTSLILPGSADAIGGQAFVIKLRETAERSPSSMLVEPPYQINQSYPNPNLPLRWRHIKHACGENPSGIYHGTRMDTIWAFREAYNRARLIKERQDEFCSAALAGKWDNLGEFPDDLKWEALVDVLRGRVKVNIHCYEAVDIDSMVRLSNEFKFSIAAFHHASEAYLIPDLLKKSYGKPPAVALFATSSRYKREAYRASEFAPRILARHGLTALMKSDHPFINSRYLLHEVQQAYYYGFPENLALASVTSNSAETMGLGHRIGYIKEGWDADLVLWDSHPLALGATPMQVFIDGVAQLESPYVIPKPANFQRLPKVPNFDKEAHEAVAYEGLPPLFPKKSPLDLITFINVKSVYTHLMGSVHQMFFAQDDGHLGVVITRNGSIVCSGSSEACQKTPGLDHENMFTIDLAGGAISPGLVSFGSPLGLQHINQESSTNDGKVYDPLIRPIPKLVGGDNSIIRAVDGLLFGSRDALLAYRAGVTTAITAPAHGGFYAGLGTSFSLGASHKLEDGSVIQAVTAVHVSIRHLSKPSVSTQIAALRRLLTGPQNGAAGQWFKKVTDGDIPLVVEAHSADIIATLISLKKEVEATTHTTIKLTVTGASEAHLLAKELSEAGIGVILNPSRPFPAVWEDRRINPGPPITRESSITSLMTHNVVVGIGCVHSWAARSLPFDIAWAAIEAGGRISKEEAFAIGSSNVEKLLGGEARAEIHDLVATRGGDLLDARAKVVAVISPRRQLVDLL